MHAVKTDVEAITNRFHKIEDRIVMAEIKLESLSFKVTLLYLQLPKPFFY